MSVPFQDVLDPNGNFPIVRDIHIEGGFRAILWDTGTYATVALALAALVPPQSGVNDTVRKRGMVIRMVETISGSITEWTYDGTNFIPYAPIAGGTALGGFGIIGGSTGDGLVTITGSSLVASIAAVTFIDPSGRLVTSPATTLSVTSAATGTVYVIVWDSVNAAFAARVTSSTAGALVTDLPFALVKLTNTGSAVISAVEDLRYRFDGSHDTSAVSVGIVSATNGVGNTSSNFPSIRAALLYINSFEQETSTTKHRPQIINVYTSYTEPLPSGAAGCIDPLLTSDTFWNGASLRLGNIKILGRQNANSGNVVTITWSGTGFLFRLSNSGGTTLRGWSIKDVRLAYTGSAAANDLISAFVGPGQGFSFDGTVAGANLSHAVYWPNALDLGNKLTSVTHGTSFKMTQGGVVATNGVFRIAAAISGVLDIEGVFAASGPLVDCTSSVVTDALAINLNKILTSGITDVFTGSLNAIKTISNSRLAGPMTIAADNPSISVNMDNCTLDSSLGVINLVGTRLITGCNEVLSPGVGSVSLTTTNILVGTSLANPANFPGSAVNPDGSIVTYASTQTSKQQIVETANGAALTRVFNPLHTTREIVEYVVDTSLLFNASLTAVLNIPLKTTGAAGNMGFSVEIDLLGTAFDSSGGNQLYTTNIHAHESGGIIFDSGVDNYGSSTVSVNIKSMRMKASTNPVDVGSISSNAWYSLVNAVVSSTRVASLLLRPITNLSGGGLATQWTGIVRVIKSTT